MGLWTEHAQSVLMAAGLRAAVVSGQWSFLRWLFGPELVDHERRQRQ